MKKIKKSTLLLGMIGVVLSFTLGMTGCGDPDSGGDDDDTPFYKDPVSLSPNVWADGSIAAEGDVKWYSFTASAGKSYQLIWNAGTSYGDGTKTLSMAKVSAFKSDGTALFTDITNG
jgi:hypothetical protein